MVLGKLIAGLLMYSSLGNKNKNSPALRAYKKPPVRRCYWDWEIDYRPHPHKIIGIFVIKDGEVIARYSVEKEKLSESLMLAETKVVETNQILNNQN